MDLHLIAGAEPSAEERAAVDAVLPPAAPDGAGRVGHAPTGLRQWLLPALQAAHARVGWITPGALNHICRRLDVPPADAYGVASFYAMLATDARPPRIAHVCDDVACQPAGAEALCAAMQARLGPAGEPRPGATSTWLRSPCLGQCERAPVALVQTAGPTPREWTLTPATADAVLADLARGAPAAPPPPPLVPQATGPGRDGLRLLRRVGRVAPDSLDAYRASGGYAAWRRALELQPEGVVREVLESRLVGRGGAAFPTGRKWEAVARATVRPHYLVLNGDESEPGTFKDRVLMEADPFAVIEAMTIAAYATGCARGYAYVRGEYPLAAERLAHAIAEARRQGWLGANVGGSGVTFDIELRRGAGAYICGEETALFNSIEGMRGEPRQKPPFPVQSGLFGKPTVINNVETLVNVLEIMRDGAAAFTTTGSGQSTGPKLFCVSGAIAKPGLYEVPFGTTLRQLLALAGDVPAGRRIQAILLGGAAGTFVTPNELDTPLTFEGTRAIGAALGSGVVCVFDDRADLQAICLRIAAFFRDESCGQCVPCRVGTVRQEEALRRLAAGHPVGSAATEVALLGEISQAMRDASICGLGHTAASAVASAIQKLGVFTGARR